MTSLGNNATHPSAPWILYGVSGYTGQLIAELAVKHGERPILAGRNATSVKAIATKLGCEYRIFSLTDPAAIRENLSGMRAVLNCAGPFEHTARSMITGCIATGCHYLDITGEIDVFEWALAQDEALKAAKIVAVPGVGFDVVPSDCLAALLKKRLPDADSLSLGFFVAGGKLSPGTAKTMAEKLDEGAKIRVSGKIVGGKAASKTRSILFAGKQRTAITIPWGDVATAYFSTAIPNIEVFLAVPPSQIKKMQRMDRLRWLFRPRIARKLIQTLIGLTVKGASHDERQKSRMYLWGEVKNKTGKTASAYLTTPDGYSLTAETALASVHELLKGQISPGFQTPSTAFGAAFIQSFSGVELRFEAG